MIEPGRTSLLLVEDEGAHAELIARAFEREGQTWVITRATSIATALEGLKSEAWDLIIADYRLPDGEGLELLGEDAGGGPSRPVLIMTSHGSEAVAADSIKRGALDYIVKSPETFASMPFHAARARRAWGLIQEKRDTEAELRRSLAEKEIILKEVHHRVKNNFQIVSSLLSLQAGIIKDPETKAALLESENRIKSMALIHEKLYESRDYSHIDFADYLRTVCMRLDSAFKGSERGIGLEYSTETVSLSIETAIPLGLVLNELVTNAFIHAFPEGRGGRISIGLWTENGDAILSVKDDGQGLPPEVDFQAPKSLGLELVKILASQAGGAPTLVTGPGGTEVSIRVPRLA
jgi:two-component sensor histidine kinase/CheY-like chemotaxis protein